MFANVNQGWHMYSLGADSVSPMADIIDGYGILFHVH